jgi:hypothetical protein
MREGADAHCRSRSRDADATLTPCSADTRQQHAQLASIFKARARFSTALIDQFAPASLRERPSVPTDGDATKLFLQPTRGFHTFPAWVGCVSASFLRRFTMTSSTDKSYFDLHITGLGYLNRIREVKPKKGDAFLACDIAALNGPSDDVSYVRFDTRVSGSEAQHLVRRCIEAVDAEKKVMIGFRLGDLWADTFTYSKGKRAGEQGVSFKARLLFLSWIKVDGKLVYKAEPKTTETDDRQDGEARTPDLPATTEAPAARQAAAPQATQPAAEAADEAAADAPALAVAESF